MLIALNGSQIEMEEIVVTRLWGLSLNFVLFEISNRWRKYTAFDISQTSFNGNSVTRGLILLYFFSKPFYSRD